MDKKMNWNEEIGGALKGPNRTEEGEVGGEGKGREGVVVKTRNTEDIFLLLLVSSHVHCQVFVALPCCSLCDFENALKHVRWMPNKTAA